MVEITKNLRKHIHGFEKMCGARVKWWWWWLWLVGSMCDLLAHQAVPQALEVPATAERAAVAEYLA